jgi:hypothetical protein
MCQTRSNEWTSLPTSSIQFNVQLEPADWQFRNLQQIILSEIFVVKEIEKDLFANWI